MAEKRSTANTGSSKKTSSSSKKSQGTKSRSESSTAKSESTKSGAKTSSTRSNTARSTVNHSNSKTASNPSRTYDTETNLFPYFKEVGLLLAFAVCTVMFLGNFGIAGVVGKWLSLFSKGVAGCYIGYVFPIILFLGIFFITRYWYDILCWVRTSGFVLVLFSILEILEVIGEDAESIQTVKIWYDSASEPGGIFAIIAAKALLPGIGKPGTVICMIVVAIIGLLLITGKSLIEVIENATDQARGTAASEREYNERRSEERRRRREAIREENERRSRERAEQEARERKANNPSRPITSGKKKAVTTDPADDSGLKIIGTESGRGSEYTEAPADAQFERPQVAAKRELQSTGRQNIQGVTKNTTVKPNMPRDTEAREFSDEMGGPIIATKRKNGDGKTGSAKRIVSAASSASNESAADYFSEENMTKLDPTVVPPEPVTPTLKPRRGKKTAFEIKGLDQTEGGNEENPILTSDDQKQDGLVEPMMPYEAEPVNLKPMKPENPYTGDRSLETAVEYSTDGRETEDSADNEGSAEAREPEIYTEANPREYAGEYDENEDETADVYQQANERELEAIEQRREEEEGYRTVVDGNGKVRKVRLNAVAGEQQLTPTDHPARAEKDDDGKMEVLKPKKLENYKFPSMDLLKKSTSKQSADDKKAELTETAGKLEETLRIFGVNAKVVSVSCGPSVTRYEIKPELGVKVAKVLNLQDDIKMSLAATDIRIQAPIPGKSLIGIEVPNKERSMVSLRDLIESPEFKTSKSKLSVAIGKDISGKIIVSDIAKMPHLLVAGSTGSGKSVSVNAMILSLLYKATPEEVKLIMVDPKVVEFSVYNGIPHLLTPIVTDPKKACGALNWAVAEMEDRYQLFAAAYVRDLKGYNEKVDQANAGLAEDDPNRKERKPQIVIIVDELADLMMVASNEIEDSIIRLAQKARAAGIHLILATQRPTVNVITGLIKANVPSRMALSVKSGVDSRTIIDMNGAEKLLGNGDMLFYPAGYPEPVRIQGAFVSDEEVNAIVESIKNQKDVKGGEQSADIETAMNQAGMGERMAGGSDDSEGLDSMYDDLLIQAGKFLIEKDKASIGMLQRMFRIGFNRAARIMDQLAEVGVVGPEEGTKPRKILMTLDEFENFVEENGL